MKQLLNFVTQKDSVFLISGVTVHTEVMDLRGY